MAACAISPNCTSGQNITSDYGLTFDTDIDTTTCDVNGTECSNGTCSHELQNNIADNRCQPPVSQFSGEGVTVSVTARNIVGRSNSSPPVTISEFSVLRD